MRYRPFGATNGMAVSTVSLLLDDRPRRSARDWSELITTAMSLGINTFELTGVGAPLLEGLGEALDSVDRRLVFLAWRLPAIGDPGQSTERLLGQLGQTYLDMLVLDDPLHLPRARELRQARIIRQIGLAAVDDLADRAVSSEGVDCLITPYSLTSGWRDRHRLKLASDRNMAVVAWDVFPEALRASSGPSLVPRSWFRRKPKIDQKSPYHFLEENHGWTGEEICLAFALFEPAVTTVRLDIDSIEHLERLAAVPERELPTGVTAQIEMARFAVEGRR